MIENKSLERHSNDDKCNPMIIPERAENRVFKWVFLGVSTQIPINLVGTIGALSNFYVGNFNAVMGILVES